MLSDNKNLKLFAFGGLAYGVVELLWRGRTHWSMLVAGGGCFLSLYRFYERFPRLGLRRRCIAGGAIITAVEYVSGCILNRRLGLGVWDYSRNLFNIKGQICPLYSLLWTLLCIPIGEICKKLRAVS